MVEVGSATLNFVDQSPVLLLGITAFRGVHIVQKGRPGRWIQYGNSVTLRKKDCKSAGMCAEQWFLACLGLDDGTGKPVGVVYCPAGTVADRQQPILVKLNLLAVLTAQTREDPQTHQLCVDLMLKGVAVDMADLVSERRRRSKKTLPSISDGESEADLAPEANAGSEEDTDGIMQETKSTGLGAPGTATRGSRRSGAKRKRSPTRSADNSLQTTLQGTRLGVRGDRTPARKTKPSGRQIELSELDPFDAPGDAGTQVCYSWHLSWISRPLFASLAALACPLVPSLRRRTTYPQAQAQRLPRLTASGNTSRRVG